jgi:hypothetical protein
MAPNSPLKNGDRHLENCSDDGAASSGLEPVPVFQQAAKPMLYTVGHSHRELDELIDALRRHQVTAVADVRSQPFSRLRPQFNQGTLQAAVRDARIAYVFLGEHLGARRQEPECYVSGKARYDRIAHLPLFRRGIDRVRQGIARGHRLALLCAELDPLVCHRAILVCRELRRAGETAEFMHIVADGALEPHAEMESRLLALTGRDRHDLFRTREELLDEAFDEQAERIAYVEKSDDEQAGDGLLRQEAAFDARGDAYEGGIDD